VTTETHRDAPRRVEPLVVYGDSAYGTGALLDGFEQAGVETRSARPSRRGRPAAGSPKASS
jgi:hypothetical protein